MFDLEHPLTRKGNGFLLSCYYIVQSAASGTYGCFLSCLFLITGFDLCCFALFWSVLSKSRRYQKAGDKMWGDRSCIQGRSGLRVILLVPTAVQLLCISAAAQHVTRLDALFAATVASVNSAATQRGQRWKVNGVTNTGGVGRYGKQETATTFPRKFFRHK